MESLLQTPPYSLTQTEKARELIALLKELTMHHCEKCFAYKNLLKNIGCSYQFEKLEDFPFIPVNLFKYYQLKSIAAEEVVKTLTSSGTTGQTPSKIYLDKYTARMQTKVLVKILQSYLGKKRLPMLIVDSKEILRNSKQFSARAAGVLGLSNFGRDHTYVLDSSMNIDIELVSNFLKKYQGQRILIFGFTFMVWQHLYKSEVEIDLSNAILLHSGGWKKLESEAVDNKSFKNNLKKKFNIDAIHNFYGLVEQVGAIFVECEKGHLHAPIYSDIIVRNPLNWQALPYGEEGIIELLSVLPHSYPGHVLLTEDLGIIQGEDDCSCQRKGKYFTVKGRIPKSEIRGCSDTYAQEFV